VTFTICLLFWPIQGATAPSLKQNVTTSKILILGDSLSAAFGIEQSQGWVSLLKHKLIELHYPYTVINASISGETSQGGLQRLPNLLKKYHPKIVILELGANDGLRGLNLSMLQHNLQLMISRCLHDKAQVLLIGMRLPPNYGPQYTQRFHHIYTELAKSNRVVLVPFLLERVATRADLMQADGLHPIAQAQPILLDTVWDKLSPLLHKQ